MPETQEKQKRLQAHLTQVLLEMQQAQQGTQNRQALIRKIESLDPAKPRRLVVYVGNVNNPASAVSTADVVPLGDVLAPIGRVKNLDLMIHTFGGSGETAEKIVEMCRRHCDGEFRVIVPNMAKSAGTLIALGADKIVMGYLSELGPIDPQIRINVGNTPQFVSAWTFIQARNKLVEQVNEVLAKGENAAAYLQQLAAIDPVFVKHCEQLMTFAERLGQKWILNRLMKQENQNAEEAEQQAEKAVKSLSNVEEHITHGRLILAREIKKTCEPPLEIIELEETDPAWQALWELYVRCEIFVTFPTPPLPPKAKLIETADHSITLH